MVGVQAKTAVHIPTLAKNITRAIVALLLASATVALTPAMSQACVWEIVPSPGFLLGGLLFGVGATSSSDVWAVGDFAYDNSVDTHGLIEHWNGVKWSVIPSPRSGHANDVLSGVTALSPSNAWAVGEASGANFRPVKPLIEHWNGKTWSFVASPAVAGGQPLLSAIAAGSPNNIWIVGSLQTSSGQKPLSEHWNGTNWVPVLGRNAGATSVFNAVDVNAAGITYAAGFYTPPGTTTHQAALIEAWSGSAWTVASKYDPGTANTLNGIEIVSSSDIWAVGSNVEDTLSENGAGTSWRIIRPPNPVPFNALFGVSGLSGFDVFAVGQSTDKRGDQFTLVEH